MKDIFMSIVCLVAIAWWCWLGLFALLAIIEGDTYAWEELKKATVWSVFVTISIAIMWLGEQ